MFKRILAPVDGGPVSLLGLHQAIKLCALEGARLRLVHVVDEMPIMGDPDTVMAAPIPELREAGRAVLTQAASVAKSSGITAEISMIETMGGNTAEFVVNEASKWGADVIVLGTHGRTGLDHFFNGSSAEDIIRATLIPVLLVRAKNEEELAAEATPVASTH